jgi:hypothetical protein
VAALHAEFSLSLVRALGDGARLGVGVVRVRILAATTAASGHFAGLLPFARACAAVGHEVRVAAPESVSGAVQ